MSSVAPLIAEAWDRNHRRRNRLLLAAAASVIGMVLIWWSSGHGTTTGSGSSAPAGAVIIRPSMVLSRPASMGIAPCHPESTTCYHVGLAVWLKAPARSVTATSSRVKSTLNRTDRRGIQMITSAHRREFIGFFGPAGIVPRAYLRTPDATPGTPVAFVRLTIVTGTGKSLVTRLRVPVQAGWG